MCWKMLHYAWWFVRGVLSKWKIAGLSVKLWRWMRCSGQLLSELYTSSSAAPENHTRFFAKSQTLRLPTKIQPAAIVPCFIGDWTSDGWSATASRFCLGQRKKNKNFISSGVSACCESKACCSADSRVAVFFTERHWWSNASWLAIYTSPYYTIL